MTVIAYRFGIMAADSRAFSGDQHPIGSKCKIRRWEDGTLIGVSSNRLGGAERVHEWLMAGRPDDFKLPENFNYLRVNPNGEVFQGDENGFESGPLKAPFHTIGSGEKYAHGAMTAGADAFKAVEAAIACDVWSDHLLYLANKDKDPWQATKN